MSQRNFRTLTRLARAARPVISASAFPARAPSQHRLLAPTRAFSATPLSHQPTSSVQTQPLVCPSCHAPLPAPSTPLCASCSTLLPPPPPSVTLFELFGLPATFDLDTGALKKRFLGFQQKVHPDMFAGRGEAEGWAKVWSGRVNDGYKLLLDPRARGEYLVSLRRPRLGVG